MCIVRYYESMQYRNHADGDAVQKQDYTKKVIFSLNDFQEKGHLLQVVTIPPQTKQRLHKHALQTEVFFILEGETSIFVNGKEFVATAGDAFIASPGDTHQLWNKSDVDFRLAVFKINMPSDSDDTEWLDSLPL